MCYLPFVLYVGRDLGRASRVCLIAESDLIQWQPTYNSCGPTLEITSTIKPCNSLIAVRYEESSYHFKIVIIPSYAGKSVRLKMYISQYSMQLNWKLFLVSNMP